MNKSTKIISSLAALGALCVGTAAMASPWHNGNCPGAGVPEAQCPIAADGPRADGPRFNKPSRQVDPAVRAARWDAIARMLTIKPEQEAAWKAYTAARDAERTPIAKTDDKKLAVEYKHVCNFALIAPRFVRTCLRNLPKRVQICSMCFHPNRSMCSKAWNSIMVHA